MRRILVLCALLLSETTPFVALSQTRLTLIAGSFVQRHVAELRCDDHGAPNSPWIRVFISVAPFTALRRVVCPVMAASGEGHQPDRD